MLFPLRSFGSFLVVVGLVLPAASAASAPLRSGVAPRTAAPARAPAARAAPKKTLHALTVEAGIAYLVRDAQVTALDLRKNRRRWQVTLPAVAAFAPLVTDGVVVLVSHDRKVYGLDSVTGKRRWSVVLKEVLLTPPLAVDGVLFIAVDLEEVQAIPVKTGVALWRKRPAGGPLAIAADGSHAYVLDSLESAGENKPSFEELVALDRRTGRVAWKVRLSKNSLTGGARLLLRGGQLYVLGRRRSDVSLSGGEVVVTQAVDVVKRRLLWTLPLKGQTFENTLSTQWLVEGDTMILAADRTVHAIDAKRGRAAWTYRIPEDESIEGVLVHGRSKRLYVRFASEIHALSLRSGARQWRRQVTHVMDKTLGPTKVDSISMHLLGNRLVHLGKQLAVVLTAFDARGRKSWATSFALPDPNLEVTAGAVWGSALYVPVQGQRVHAVTAAGRTRKLLGVR